MGRVKTGTRVLDIGCANPYMCALLKESNHCSVTGVAVSPRKPGVNLDRFIPHDLNAGAPAVQFDDYDYVLMLDVLEHLASPEDFIGSLKRGMSMAPDTELLVSTANVGFFIPRLMLLLGQFNYGKRGILDMTHTRLFTFRSLRRLFEQAGFQVIEEQGIPGPFPLAIGDNRVSRFLLWVNRVLIRLSRGAFSYQIFMVVKPLPSLEYLLRAAYENRGDAAETG